MEEQRRFKNNIDLATLPDNFDFGASDVKTIEQADLQNFLMSDPIISDDAPTTEKIKPREPSEDHNSEKKEISSSGANNDPFNDPTEEIDNYLKNKEQDKAPIESKETSIKSSTTKDVAKGSNKTEVIADDDENIYGVLNTDLIKAGIFTPEEENEEINDAAAFKEKFIKEMKRGATSLLDQYLNQHGSEYKDAFDAIFVNGVNPATYFSLYSNIENIESLDLSKPENQESVLKTFYQAKGFSPEKITTKIQKLQDYGDLEDEAKEVHGILIKEEKETLALEEKRAIEENKKRDQNKQHYQNSIQHILTDKIKSKTFDGIPVTQTLANKIYNNLTTDAYRLPDGRLITEFEKSILELDRPQNFEKKLKLAFLLAQDLNLDIVKKEAISAETNDIFEGLERKKRKKLLPTREALLTHF